MDFEDFALYAQNGPEFESEDEVDAYTSEVHNSGLTGEDMDETDREIQSFVDDWKNIMEVSGVINDCTVRGEGKGKEIAGAVAAMLDSEQYYSFKLAFYREDESQKQPDDDWD